MLWIRVKYKLLLYYRVILLKVGFRKLLFRKRYGERILVFHGIDLKGETKYNSRFISKNVFEAFIKYITEHYNVISLDDYYAKKFKPDTLNIAITFDDGYLNNYKYAVPILEKYNNPACFYITAIHEKAPYLPADFIDLISYHSPKKELFFEGKLYHKNKKKEFVCNTVTLKQIAKTLPFDALSRLYKLLREDWQNLKPDTLEDYWKLMRPEHIKTLSKHPLFTIGAHGETHASLIDISLEAAQKEIKNSKHILDTICEHPVNEFAFPFGFYNNKLGHYCQSIGFKKVLLVDYNKIKDKKIDYYRNRFVMNPYISIDMQLIYLLKGNYF